MATLKESFIELEKQTVIDESLKKAIETEVFGTLDRLKLVSNIFDLFTVNFFNSGIDFFKGDES